MKKRFLVGLLAMVMCCSTFTTPITTQAATILEAQKDAYVDYVQDKLDTLNDLLGGKYFTTDQKACSTTRKSSHGCSDCSVYNIVYKDWFKEMFGNVSTSNFPEHDVNVYRRDHSGQSCFGFCCFAQYYVFQTDGNQKVTAERVATGKFNRSFAEANILPGDVLRLNSSHSVIVYSVESDGIIVLDCNWNTGGQLNCLVQKHKIAYTNKNYSGKTVYVNRVNNFDTFLLENDKLTNETKVQYGYYHYTNGAGDYSVCAYYGIDDCGWKKADVYREEIWVDEPLELVSKSATSYRHVNLGSSCANAGCTDETWYGGKYKDENGVYWYHEQTRVVEVKNEFSEWTSDDSLASDPRYEVETKQVIEYAYTERETTTSKEKNLPGWSYFGTSVSWEEVIAPTTQVLTAGAGEKVETVWQEVEKETTVYRYCNYFWVDSDGDWRATSARLVPSYYTLNNEVSTYSKRFVGTYTGSGSGRKSNGEYNIWYSAEYTEPLSYTSGKGWKDASGTTWWQDASYVTTTKEMVLCYRKLKAVEIYNFDRYTTVNGLTERPEEKKDRYITENQVTYYRYRLK